MNVWVKRAALAGLVLLTLAGGFVAIAWWRADLAMARTYTVRDAPLPMQTADAARGRYLYETRGCSDCHGADGSGIMQLDAGPVAQIHAANITPTGLAGRYDADRLGAVIRHGVHDDGTTLVFMPSMDWSQMTDNDVADLVAYVLQMPPAGKVHPRSTLGPLGRVLWFTGKAATLLPATVIDHRPRTRPVIAMSASAEYGKYLVAMCRGCHGRDLTGGIDLGPGEPRSANINMARGGLAGWQQADFMQAMHSGRRPDGRQLADIMPWRAIGKMKQTEREAIWAYLSRPQDTAAAE